MRAAGFALLLVCACSSPPAAPPPDGSAPRDLATADGNRFGIACGSATCPSTISFCCTADSGQSGTCQSTQMPNCGDTSFYCDGPEDCPPAMPECCIAGGVARCGATGECSSITMGTLMCQVDADCGGGHCCAAPAGPYHLCFPSGRACP